MQNSVSSDSNAKYWQVHFGMRHLRAWTSVKAGYWADPLWESPSQQQRSHCSLRGFTQKGVSYILDCSVWYFQLHRIKGSPSEKDYEQPSDCEWGSASQVSQAAQCLVSGTGDRRKKGRKYSQLTGGEERGGRNHTNLQICLPAEPLWVAWCESHWSPM